MAIAARPMRPPFLLFGLADRVKSFPRTTRRRRIWPVLFVAMYSFTILKIDPRGYMTMLTELAGQNKFLSRVITEATVSS